MARSWRGVPAETANTESCLSRATLLQEGHSGAAAPVTMVSKACPQSRHTYSKIGIHTVYRDLE